MTSTSQPMTVRHFRKDAIMRPHVLNDFKWPEAFLSSDAALDLEIGCGVGWHPIRYSTENPQRRLIAIEHTRAKFERFAKRIEANGSPSNLLGIHADAMAWLAHAPLGETRFDRCFLLYPNPEPKAPSRRWIRMPFFSHLLEMMKTGGEITIATNEAWYAEEVGTWAEKTWGLEVQTSELRAGSKLSPHYPRTHFEKKYLERGETCFDIRLHT